MSNKLSLKNINYSNIINTTPPVLFGFVCLLPLYSAESLSKVVFLFFATTIILKFKTGVLNFNPLPLLDLIYNTAFYIFLIFTLFYSNNIDRGIEIIIRQISFLLFPVLVFYFLKPTQKQLVIYAKVFIISNLIVCIYLIYYVFNYTGINSYADLVTVYNKFDFRTIIETDNLKDWHPTYVGFFILISIMLLIEGFFSFSKKIKLICLIFILFFISILIFLNSRAALYSFVGIVPIFLFFRVKTFNARLLIVSLTIFSGFMLFQIVNNNSSLNYRLFLQIEKLVDWVYTGKISEIGIDNRFYINKCNWRIFMHKPWFGYGIGDLQYYLNNCYLDNEYFKLYFFQFNTHSIYFYFLLTGGILSLLLFLILFINNLLVSFKKSFYLYSFILLSFLLLGLSENFLVRLNGIVLFSGINALMYYKIRLSL